MTILGSGETGAQSGRVEAPLAGFLGPHTDSPHIFQPVREARVVWARTYSEQLSLTTDDVAPWLLRDTGTPLPTPLGPLAAGIAEKPNTNASCSHGSGRVAREQEAEGV